MKRLRWTLVLTCFVLMPMPPVAAMDRNNVSAMLTLDLPGRWQIGGGVDYSKKENGMPVFNRPDSPYYDSSYPDADEDALGGPGTGKDG